MPYSLYVQSEICTFLSSALRRLSICFQVQIVIQAFISGICRYFLIPLLVCHFQLAHKINAPTSVRLKNTSIPVIYSLFVDTALVSVCHYLERHLRAGGRFSSLGRIRYVVYVRISTVCANVCFHPPEYDTMWTMLQKNYSRPKNICGFWRKEIGIWM